MWFLALHISARLFWRYSSQNISETPMESHKMVSCDNNMICCSDRLIRSYIKIIVLDITASDVQETGHQQVWYWLCVNEQRKKWYVELTHWVRVICISKLTIIIPPAQKSCWGVYWFHSVRRSVRPFVLRPSRIRPTSRVHSVASTVLVGSISYLYILSSNFSVSYAKFLAKFQNLKFCQFFTICNFDFVFWLGIWCESLVWVIRGLRGVSQNAGVLVLMC